MRAWNRAKLLWGYLRRKERLEALPVEYIVETTAKCNLYCPMCPRETHKQPKEDMTDDIFERLVARIGPIRRAHDADRPGRAVPGSQDFRPHRVLRAAQHLTRCCRPTARSSTRRLAQRLLDSPLEHITLSFDGSTKESFEFYRKGAKFEKVRDNFVRFARMKKERGARLQIVVQMVRMERNAGEVDDFMRFWSAHAGRGPGSHQRRRNEPDAARTPAMQPRTGSTLPLPVARADVREAERRRVSVLPELHAGRRTAGRESDEAPLERDLEFARRCSGCGSLHAAGRAR